MRVLLWWASRRGATTTCEGFCIVGKHQELQYDRGRATKDSSAVGERQELRGDNTSASWGSTGRMPCAQLTLSSSHTWRYLIRRTSFAEGKNCDNVRSNNRFTTGLPGIESSCPELGKGN